MTIHMSTAVAPINIAVIKYWGKKDENLIIPINDSISVTLSKKMMCAKTTVACSQDFQTDRIWLNGRDEDINNPRLQQCIIEIKRRSTKPEFKDWKLHICSENNFPTAAGLASSAAGFACLVKSLAELYGVKDDLSIIARQGSGSACRSMYGGFVHWKAGTQKDGTDSFAQQIAQKEHWPELRAIILVVDSSKKAISSTKGMQNSVQTSQLLKYRASNVVPNNVTSIKKAILSKNFETFAEITMKESNQFHAICLDTFPPIHYLNSISHAIMNLVHLYNEYYGVTKVAYTFDAGPNACLYLLEKDVSEIICVIQHFFPPSDDRDFVSGLKFQPCRLTQELLNKLNVYAEPFTDQLSYIINTQIGSGPTVLSNSDKHLLDHNGLPLLPADFKI